MDFFFLVIFYQKMSTKVSDNSQDGFFLSDGPYVICSTEMLKGCSCLIKP